ncbi:MAG: thermonuclease family protein [Rhodospirillales bacterium]|nr:thermonuclease family protein [Rhodospirillales bacterium]
MMARPLILATVLLALIAGPARSGEITGAAHAINGDTMEVGGLTLRLYGIDAPELAQTCTSKKGKLQHCGDLARQMLDTLTKNIKVKCKEAGSDADGTTVATCFAGPFDINEQMIAAGWAFALMDEVPAYARAENFAKARLEGIWRGTFDMPAQWRKEHGAQ